MNEILYSIRRKNLKQVRSLIKKLNAKGFTCVNDSNLIENDDKQGVIDSIGSTKKGD